MNDLDYPDWVAYIAQDADGSWWGFEHEPNQYHAGWYENELGRRIKLRSADKNPCWKTTLVAVRGV